MRLNKYALTLVVLGCSSVVMAQTIVNIDGQQHALFQSTLVPATAGDPAPVLAGTTPLQLTLPAGTYTITNAAGLSGALYEGWSAGSGFGYFWYFAIADASTNTALLVGLEGLVDFPNGAPTPAQLTALPAVQNYSATLTLPATTTLNFGIVDSPLGDNQGGISILIVPEPATLALLSAGLIALARRRR